MMIVLQLLIIILSIPVVSHVTVYTCSVSRGCVYLYGLTRLCIPVVSHVDVCTCTDSADCIPVVSHVDVYTCTVSCDCIYL